MDPGRLERVSDKKKRIGATACKENARYRNNVYGHKPMLNKDIILISDAVMISWYCSYGI